MVFLPLLAFAKAIVAPVDSDDYPVDSLDEAAKITITLCLLCLAGKKIFVSAELIEASGTIVSVWRLGSKVALVKSGRSTKVCSKCRHIRIRLRERRRG